MRVLFCWPDISGYMAACWRELSGRSGMDVRIVAFVNRSTSAAPFNTALVAGLNCSLMDQADRENDDLVLKHVLETPADVVVLPGWGFPVYRRLVGNPKLAHVRFVMTMDTAWRGTMRQTLGRVLLRRFIQKMDSVIVSGERSYQYAMRLGASPRRIFRGMYAADARSFAHCFGDRVAAHGGWPRRFLYVGRYAPEKGIDVLLDAYSRYRKTTPDPWRLDCCGAGTLSSQLDGLPGVRNRGFIQPAAQPGVFAESGAFVIASRYEPWGVVIAEAAAAGLPVLCTDACGAGIDIVRPYYNGRMVASEDPEGLAEAMSWIDRNHAIAPTLGARSMELANAFSAQSWADRWVGYLNA